MNKNSVLINLNANIINTKTPIEQFKVQQKINEYKKYLNKKINEVLKKNKKNAPIIPPPSNKNYKKINKYFKKNNNKRKNSPFQNMQNIKLNFNTYKNNNSINSSGKNKSKKINLTKNNFDFYTNIIQKPINIFNINNNVASRSSSNNSKSSLNVAKKSNKNSNKNKLNKKKALTSKNYVFCKK